MNRFLSHAPSSESWSMGQTDPRVFFSALQPYKPFSGVWSWVETKVEIGITGRKEVGGEISHSSIGGGVPLSGHWCPVQLETLAWSRMVLERQCQADRGGKSAQTWFCASTAGWSRRPASWSLKSLNRMCSLMTEAPGASSPTGVAQRMGIRSAFSRCPVCHGPQLSAYVIVPVCRQTRH